MTETEKNKELKFRAHESFYIRKGWLSKGMKNVAKKNDLFIDKNVPATVSLGLGTNMVKSLKYWLGVTGLIEKDKVAFRSANIAKYLDAKYMIHIIGYGKDSDIVKKTLNELGW